MLALEEARARILTCVRPLDTERTPLSAAAGRIVAEAITAPLDLPRFDNSAMDGYALHAADVAAASAESPVALRFCGYVAPGETWSDEIPQQSCVRIFTGSLLPPGADAVIMQEETRVSAEQPGNVLFLASAKPWENVRFRGEDVKQGATVLAKGDVLTAGGINLLAALGFKEVEVSRRPVVGLVATGSELVEPGLPLPPARIYECNRASLSALIVAAGAEPSIFPLVPDDLAATCAALERALTTCDVVVTTGGASVGAFDFVRTAFETIGGTPFFWNVAIRPGKPVMFGRRHKKLLFGLPGNPVSAAVTFLMLVRPALRCLQNAADVDLPGHPGVLAEPVVNPGDRRHFVRVVVDSQGNVRSAGRQGSHILGSLAKANGLVDVPAHANWPKGKTVAVLRCF